MSGPKRESAFGRLQQEQARAAETTTLRPIRPVREDLPFTGADARIISSQPTPAVQQPRQEVIKVDLDAAKEAYFQQLEAERLAGELSVSQPMPAEQGLVFQETITRRVEANSPAAQILLNGQPLSFGTLVARQPDYSPAVEDYYDETPAAALPAPADDLFRPAMPAERRGFDHKRRVVAARLGAVGLLAATTMMHGQVGAAFRHMGYEHRLDIPGAWQAFWGNDTEQPDPASTPDISPSSLPSMEPTPDADMEGNS